MAIKLNMLKFDIAKTLERGRIILIEDGKVFEGYNEGIKTGPAGVSYVCLSEALGFEKVNIKVPGTLVPQVEYKGEPIPVTFTGLEGKVWQDFSNKGEIKLSITAGSIQRADGKTRLKVTSGGEV